MRLVQGSMPESEPTQDGVPGTRQLLAVVHTHCGILGDGRAAQGCVSLPLPLTGPLPAYSPAATRSRPPWQPRAPAARSGCRTRRWAGGTATCTAPRPARSACPWTPRPPGRSRQWSWSSCTGHPSRRCRRQCRRQQWVHAAGVHEAAAMLSYSITHTPPHRSSTCWLKQRSWASGSVHSRKEWRPPWWAVMNTEMSMTGQAEGAGRHSGRSGIRRRPSHGMPVPGDRRALHLQIAVHGPASRAASGSPSPSLYVATGSPARIRSRAPHACKEQGAGWQCIGPHCA